MNNPTPSKTFAAVASFALPGFGSPAHRAGASLRMRTGLPPHPSRPQRGVAVLDAPSATLGNSFGQPSLRPSADLFSDGSVAELDALFQQATNLMHEACDSLDDAQVESGNQNRCVVGENPAGAFSSRTPDAMSGSFSDRSGLIDPADLSGPVVKRISHRASNSELPVRFQPGLFGDASLSQRAMADAKRITVARPPLQDTPRAQVRVRLGGGYLPWRNADRGMSQQSCLASPSLEIYGRVARTVARFRSSVARLFIDLDLRFSSSITGRRSVDTAVRWDREVRYV